jgi:hypothetical protein
MRPRSPEDERLTKWQARVRRGLRRALTLIAPPAALIVSPSSAHAGPAQDSRQIPAPALIWSVTQLIPSPELAASDGQVHAGLRWELTPLLLSFGVTEHPVRALRVDPIARHAGSVGFYLAPEFLDRGNGRVPWLGRAGGRLYLPLWQRGENFSMSLGGSAYVTDHATGGSAELGLYTLYGVLGLQLTYSPNLYGGQWVSTLSIRYL